MSSFIYPSSSTSSVVHTDFVGVVRFDVYEVCEEMYTFLSNKRSRFFLVCEEVICGCGVSSAKQYHSVSGQSRWEFFCAEKAECISKISAFSAIMLKYNSAGKKCENKAFAIKYLPIKNKLALQIKTQYGYEVSK